jgi:hypothetical protein
MSLVSNVEYQPHLEQHLERWTLHNCLPATFVQCLISNGIAPTIQFTTAKGTSITIGGSDIAGTRTWKKFLKSLTHEGQTYSLSKDGAALAEFYPLHQLWLLRETTKELARLVHHILDDPEHERRLIEQFCSTLDDQVRNHTLVVPNVLPQLPQGVSHPFLLLSERQEGDDE